MPITDTIKQFVARVLSPGGQEPVAKAFDPSQPRDEHGRWTDSVLDVTEEDIKAMSFEQYEAFDKKVASQWGELHDRRTAGKSLPDDAETNKRFLQISHWIHYKWSDFDAERKQRADMDARTIAAGEPWKVPAGRFVEYHKTGHISSTAYDQYRTREGIAWLGGKEKFPELVERRQDGVEYRRDADGDIAAFDEKGPIGWVADEFGVPGVWVIDEQQKKGIGTDLLQRWMATRPTTQKIGQMTDSGAMMTRAYHRRLVEQAIRDGKDVPQDVLESHGLPLSRVAKFNPNHDPKDGKFSSGGGIVVYHGTQHDVPNFDLQHVGEGEGAQAYGWGLYFAEEKGVAQSYRTAGTSGVFTVSESIIPGTSIDGKKNAEVSDVKALAREVSDVSSFIVRSSDVAYQQKVGELYSDAAKRFIDKKEDWTKKEKQKFVSQAKKLDGRVVREEFGNLYEVRLHVRQGELLDWDKTLDLQGPTIQHAVRSILDEAVAQGTDSSRTSSLAAEYKNYDFSEKTGEDFYRELQGLLGSQSKYAQMPYYASGENPIPDAAQTASETLKRHGIPGLFYLDGGSRGRVEVSGPSDGGKWLAYGSAHGKAIHEEFTSKEAAYEFASSKGTHNFVIWDDSKIEITHQNGKPLSREESLAKSAEMRFELIAKFNENHDERGRFASGAGAASGKAQTETPEFKAWFKDSKVVDEQGKPLVVYHGSRSNFEAFDTTSPKGYTFDRQIGAHFAVDSSVPNAFTAGTYAFAHDYHVGSDGDGWYRENGEIKRDGIPVLVRRNGFDDEVVEPYNPEKHGGIYSLSSKMGPEYGVRMLKPGGMTYPVYLSIQNPLVVESPAKGGIDQNNVTRAVEKVVFPRDKQLFVDAYSVTGEHAEYAGKLWDAFQSGASQVDGDPVRWKGWDEFIADYGIGLLDRPELAKRAKEVLKEAGYDGLTYRNTSLNEVSPGASDKTWIALDPWQIKSVWNKGSWDKTQDELSKAQRLVNFDEGKHPRDESGKWTEAGATGPVVTLYRGDSADVVHSLSHSDPLALFGAGIYLTDSKRIANDYRAKGAEVVFRAQNASKSEAVDRYIRHLARNKIQHPRQAELEQKIAQQYAVVESEGKKAVETAKGTAYESKICHWSDAMQSASVLVRNKPADMPELLLAALSKVSDAKDSAMLLQQEIDSVEDKLPAAKSLWDATKKALDIRKLADGSVVFRKKDDTGVRTEISVPESWVKHALDAEAEITPEVAGALAGTLAWLGDVATAADVRAAAKHKDEDGFKPSFRQIYTSITSGSPLMTDAGQKAWRTALKELGYKGIKYAGGVTMGGPAHTAYVFWDEQGLRKLQQERVAKYRPDQPRDEYGRWIPGSIDTPEFKAWFDESQVRHADGKPRVVYHGTVYDFDSMFDTSKGEIGAHFTEDSKVADQFSANPPWVKDMEVRRGGKVFPVYLSIQNPLRMEDPGSWTMQNVIDAIVRDYDGAGIQQKDFDVWREKMQQKWDEAKGRKFTERNAIIREMLEHYGYDGIKYLNRREGDIPPEVLHMGTAEMNKLSDREFKALAPKASTCWIALRPSQIKSVWNKGDWDKNQDELSKTEVLAKDFDEGKHPRAPKGSSAGGQFVGRTETPEFKAWFADSKVVTDDGKPQMLFSGHSNAEMFGAGFDPKKATAGGFYFTDDPKIASNYATGKMGVKESYENGDQYRLAGANGKFNKKIWQVQLTPEQVQKAREFFADEANGVGDIEEYIRENKDHDPDAARAFYRGGIKDLHSVWKIMESMGYNIAYADEGDSALFLRQNKNNFEELLDHLGIKWQSADWSQPGVFPVYLSIQKPLDASNPPKELLDDLHDAVKGKRSASWDKVNETHWTRDYPLKNWVEDLDKQLATGEETFWATQVPKDALPILRRHGFDGIKDTGGKMGGPQHAVWIAFEPGQVKSAIGNKGTYDRSKSELTKAWDESEHPRDKDGKFAESQVGAKAVEHLRDYVLSHPQQDTGHSPERVNEMVAVLRRDTGKVLAEYEQGLNLEGVNYVHDPASGFSAADMFDKDGNYHPDGSILHLHTHPIDSSFSDGDWRVFARNTIGEMRVVTPRGVYTLVKTEKFAEKPWQDRTPAAIGKLWNDVEDELFATQDTDAPGWTDQLIDKINRAMAQRTGVEYSFRPHQNLSKSQATMPAALAGAKPRYGFGSKLFQLEFANDIDKALYIIGGARSKRHAKYMSWLEQATGLTVRELKSRAAKLRAHIKQQARVSAGETLVITGLWDGGDENDALLVKSYVQRESSDEYAVSAPVAKSRSKLDGLGEEQAVRFFIAAPQDKVQTLLKSGELERGQYLASTPTAARLIAKFNQNHDERGRFASGAGAASGKAQTETPEFKAWFKESKVVDEHGKPLVVYHGTDKNFTAFRKQRRGFAYYFTADPEDASSYATTGRGANVLPVYLSVQHPYTGGSVDHILEAVRRADDFYPYSLATVRTWLEHQDAAAFHIPSVVQAVRKLGHDGFIEIESGRKAIGVFRREQIKSATGNNGRFDPKESDITKSQAPVILEVLVRRGDLGRPLVGASGPGVYYSVRKTKAGEAVRTHEVRPGGKAGKLPVLAVRPFTGSLADAVPLAKDFDEGKHPRDGRGRFASVGSIAPDTEEFRSWFNKSKVVDDNGAPLVMYHGTNAEFSAFDSSWAGRTDDGYYGQGFYFTPDRDEAKEYGARVMPVYLSLQNPFVVKNSPNMGDPSLFDVRDALAQLPGMPEGLKTNRQIPEGYHVESRVLKDGDWGWPGKDATVYSVAPNPELYGTERERYGEEAGDPLSATVMFNDELAGNKGQWNSGWAFGLLRDIGRDKFKKALLQAGHDGVVVRNAEDGSIGEVVAFKPEQIKSVANRRPSADADINKAELLAKDFDEASHPRDEHGRFAESGRTRWETVPVKGMPVSEALSQSPDAAYLERVSEASEAQRGNPESVMMRSQSHVTGYLAEAIEHIGDLSHAAGHLDASRTYNMRLPGLMEKVSSFSRALSDRPGRMSFEQEVESSYREEALEKLITSPKYNSRWEKAEQKVASAKFPSDKHEKAVAERGALIREISSDPAMAAEISRRKQETAEALKSYVEAHAKLEPVTQWQWHGQQAAIALGKQDWAKLREHVFALRDELKQYEQEGEQKGWARMMRPHAAVAKAEPSDAELIAKFNENHDPETGRFSSGGGSITAYHGTPHDVDHFTTGKVGTGEGHQSYGWGLYFADTKDVAQYYADVVHDDAMLDRNNARMADLARVMEADSTGGHRQFRSDAGRKAAEEYDRLMQEKITPGRMYTVKLNVKNEQLLDWDNPVSPELIERLIAIGPRVAGMPGRPQHNESFEERLRDGFTAQEPGEELPDGGELYRTLSDSLGSQKRASELLQSVGMSGVRYLDQNSRMKAKPEYWEDEKKWAVEWAPNNYETFDTEAEAQKYADRHRTSNYVIWDESKVEITHKNGKPVSREEALAKSAQWREELHPRDKSGRFSADAELQDPRMSAITKESLAQALRLPDHPAVLVSVTRVQPHAILQRPHTIVEGELSQDGKPIGTFAQLYGIDPQGKLYVDLTSLEMDKAHQGSGIGSEFVAQAEAAAQQMGASYLTLVANCKVGGLAWALHGYDFASDAEREEVANTFKAELTQRLATNAMVSNEHAASVAAVDGLRHSWQFAAFGTASAPRFGRETLLTKVGPIGWAGRKDIDPESDGWKLGQTYQQLKAKRESR